MQRSTLHATDLVVEQTSALFDKDNAELLGGLEDGTVVLATAGSRDVLGAGTGRTEDVVDEGELQRLESVRGQRGGGEWGPDEGHSRRHPTRPQPR